MRYVLGIDQSTQGTKAILVDEDGKIIGRADRSHRQIIDENGWVSHDLDEIYKNVILSIKDVVEKTGIDKEDIAVMGISNQRETTALWDRDGNALNYAIVWQCSRAKQIADKLEKYGQMIREHTGLLLSPYFSAAKMAWLLQNTDLTKKEGKICLGTIDSWLLYKLTRGKSFKTDYSNASRTQLFHIYDLKWDEKICELFEIPMEYLPTVCDSNSEFGKTDLEGFLEHEIPIYSVMGDSHAALFGQGCHKEGMIKTTYGTGSSIMMNTGKNGIHSNHGLVTSLAWGMDGKVDYVLEGNINYTGAVISWLQNDINLIKDAGETEKAALAANPDDETILVPAFSGLGAPYWNDNAKALLCGMSRTTKREEIIRAALDSIAFQIDAVLDAMEKDSKIKIEELRVDGGPTKNQYLMQFQSDLTDTVVSISKVEELSALGVVYMAGLAVGIFEKEKIFSEKERKNYYPEISKELRQKKKDRWKEAVELVMR